MTFVAETSQEDISMADTIPNANAAMNQLCKSSDALMEIRGSSYDASNEEEKRIVTGNSVERN